MKVLPVIHILNEELTREQVALAFNLGADGVFLISHHGDNGLVRDLAAQFVVTYGRDRIGINLLGDSFRHGYEVATRINVGMLWTDTSGIRSEEVSQETLSLSDAIKNDPDRPLIFASVAFKNQPLDRNPAMAACGAASLGMIATTSGPATGIAPKVEKIAAMSAAIKPKSGWAPGKLAVASGLTADNLGQYKGLIDYALVATGISKDEYRIDPDKLTAFKAAAR